MNYSVKFLVRIRRKIAGCDRYLVDYTRNKLYKNRA